MPWNFDLPLTCRSSLYEKLAGMCYIGLTEDSALLLRWMACEPEIARFVNEFECNLPYFDQDNGDEYKHHEENGSKQQRFSLHVLNLCKVISNVGNPSWRNSVIYLYQGYVIA
jgi:hypothetical protein